MEDNASEMEMENATGVAVEGDEKPSEQPAPQKRGRGRPKRPKPVDKTESSRKASVRPKARRVSRSGEQRMKTAIGRSQEESLGFFPRLDGNVSAFTGNSIMGEEQPSTKRQAINEDRAITGFGGFDVNSFGGLAPRSGKSRKEEYQPALGNFAWGTELNQE